MRSQIWQFLFGLVLVVSCVLPAAWGQQRNVEREGVRLEGTLKALQPGLLQVEAKDGELWLIKVEAKGKDLLYTAAAKADWLRPGLWIRFRASFNQRGQLESELADVTVFTPREDQQLGLIPEVSLGEGLFSDEQETAPKERNRNQVTPYVVAGRIASLKRGRMTVAAGNVPVTVAVPEDLRIAVEVSDYSLAQPGDRVEIQGWKYPMVPGRAIANRLTINSDAVLAAPTPMPRRGAKKPAKTEPAPPAADETDKPDADTP